MNRRPKVALAVAVTSGSLLLIIAVVELVEGRVRGAAVLGGIVLLFAVAMALAWHDRVPEAGMGTRHQKRQRP